MLLEEFWNNMYGIPGSRFYQFHPKFSIIKTKLHNERYFPQKQVAIKIPEISCVFVESTMRLKLDSWAGKSSGPSRLAATSLGSQRSASTITRLNQLGYSLKPCKWWDKVPLVSPNSSSNTMVVGCWVGAGWKMDTDWSSYKKGNCPFRPFPF